MPGTLPADRRPRKKNASRQTTRQTKEPETQAETQPKSATLLSTIVESNVALLGLSRAAVLLRFHWRRIRS